MSEQVLWLSTRKRWCLSAITEMGVYLIQKKISAVGDDVTWRRRRECPLRGSFYAIWAGEGETQLS